MKMKAIAMLAAVLATGVVHAEPTNAELAKFCGYMGNWVEGTLKARYAGVPLSKVMKLADEESKGNPFTYHYMEQIAIASYKETIWKSPVRARSQSSQARAVVETECFETLPKLVESQKEDTE